MYQKSDHCQILELIHRYCHGVDTKNHGEVLHLWAADAVFDETCVGAPLCSNKEEIAAYFTSAFTRMTEMMHICCNEVIDFSDDETADGRTTVLFEGLASNGNRTTLKGIFNDRFKKMKGGWLFAERRLVLLSPPERR